MADEARFLVNEAYATLPVANRPGACAFDAMHVVLLRLKAKALDELPLGHWRMLP
jgi:hypothetical protein